MASGSAYEIESVMRQIPDARAERFEPTGFFRFYIWNRRVNRAEFLEAIRPIRGWEVCVAAMDSGGFPDFHGQV